MTQMNPSPDAKILIVAYQKLGLHVLDATSWALEDYEDLLKVAKEKRRMTKRPEEITQADGAVAKFQRIVDEVGTLHSRLLKKYY